MLLSGFLAAFAEAVGENGKVPGQELAAGLLPFLPPHVCSKDMSFHGKMCLQTSQARTDVSIGGFQIPDSKNQ